MTDSLTIDFTPAEGAVLRMLGLVERRGYLVRGISMSEQPDGASLTLQVEPRDASRRLPVVAQQLDRLIEVKKVSISPREAGTDQ